MIKTIQKKWLLTIITIIIFVQIVNAQICFTKTQYPLYYGGGGIVSADFNNDSKEDVLIGFADGKPAQVILNCNTVGIKEINKEDSKINIYPIPAKEVINVELLVFSNEAYKIKIINSLGQIIREEDITFKDNLASINTKELPNGVYFLRQIPFDSAQGDKLQTASKRFVIAR